MSNTLESNEVAAPVVTKTTLIPHITCRNAFEAVEFYKKAFGAEVLMIVPNPDGKLMHAGIEIDGATIYIVDEFPEFGGKSPQLLNGTPVTLHLQVPDCNAVYQKAVDAGCTVVMPLEDMFWGDRWGLLTDPYGHSWSVATPKRVVSAEEMGEVLKQMAESGQGCGSQE